MRITLAAASAPEGHDKTGRRRQAPPRRRARIMRRVLGRIARQRQDKARIFAGLFESGTRMAREAELHGWTFMLSDPPNNRLRDGTVRGNGGLWYGIPGLRRTSTLKINVGPRFLHFPIFTMADHNLAIIVGHRETARSDPDGHGRRAAAEALSVKVRSLLRAGWHVIVIVDWNGGEPLEDVDGITVAARDGVDWILVSEGIKVRARRVYRGWRIRRATDHKRIVVVDVEVP